MSARLRFSLILVSVLVSSPENLPQLYQDNSEIFNGHTSHCFEYALLSYQSCLQLFLSPAAISCTYLKYSNQICSLHNHNHPTFISTPDDPPSISHPEGEDIRSGQSPIILTKLPNISTSTPLSNNPYQLLAIKKYRKCLDKKRNQEEIAAKFQSLPTLAIVISVTSEWVQNHESGVKSFTSNFECYAKVHNYSFHLNVLPNMPPSKFYYQRHRSILHNYLPYHQHVLHLDADSLILNHSRSFDRFLSNPLVDIHLHLHENSEVTAAIYLLRNSIYSRCFLEYWSDFSPVHVDIASDLRSLDSIGSSSPQSRNLPSTSLFSSRASSLLSNPHPPSQQQEYASYVNTYEVPNYDNGDLVSAIFNLLYPNKYFECINLLSQLNRSQWKAFINPYHQTIVECWKTTHRSLHRYLQRSIIPKTRIQIYFPHEGFWRTKGKPNRFGGITEGGAGEWWNHLFGRCFPSFDLIGHGWKAMARTLWPLPDQEFNDLLTHETNQINVTELFLKDQKKNLILSQCQSTEILSGNGANPRCQWLSEEEELRVSQRYCLWKAPICQQPLNSSIDCSSSAVNDPTLCRNKCLFDENSRCASLRQQEPTSITTSGSNSQRHRALRTKDPAKKKKRSPGGHASSSSSSLQRLFESPPSFGVEYEEWWKEQLCAACPH